MRNEFYSLQEPTIGAAFLTQTIPVKDKTVKFEIWDTAGQEKYRSLASIYYRGADAALLVFDLTKKESFEGVQKWIKEHRLNSGKNAVIALAGNKSDVPVESREVDTTAVKAFAEENGLIYLETSAKTGENVNELFTTIANKMPMKNSTSNPSLSKIDQFSQAQSGGAPCCF